MPLGSTVRTIERDQRPSEDAHEAALRMRYTPAHWRLAAPPPRQRRQPPKS
jgi:hypothetical protein